MAIQTAIADPLDEVRRLDMLAALQVGDGSRHPSRSAREQVRFLQANNDPAVAHYSAGFIITACGREVADAIDAVAERLEDAATFG